MSTENNQQPNPTQPPYQEDEIDLRELFSTLWKGKWIIIVVTFIFAVASVGYALYLPNEYKATAIVQPNESGGGGKLSQLAGQFGGLASLAGINLGNGDFSDAVIATEIMRSWGFAEQFINKHELAVPLFASKGWEKSSNSLILDGTIYNGTENKWTRVNYEGDIGPPSSWELYKVYGERIFVEKNQETGLFYISVVHYSPFLAKRWVEILISDINQHMKGRALKEANENINYLNKQINETSVAEIRTIFSELIQEQHKTKMLAQASDEYVFKTISSAKIPEEKVKPNRPLIAILGTFAGGILSLLLVLLLNFSRKNK